MDHDRHFHLETNCDEVKELCHAEVSAIGSLPFECWYNDGMLKTCWDLLHFCNGIEDLFQPQYQHLPTKFEMFRHKCNLAHQLQSPEGMLCLLNTNLTVIHKVLSFQRFGIQTWDPCSLQSAE